MNQKYLIIGDQHNWGFLLEPFVKEFPNHTIIYMGDALDNWNDESHIASKTAVWLQYSLNQPNRIHLWGNHDISYHYSNNGTYFCPGFTEGKNLSINSIMKPRDWDKLKFYYVDPDYNFWYSHAGFNTHYFPEMDIDNWEANGFDLVIQSLDNRFKQIFPIKDKTDPIIWASDYRRGGIHSHSGLLWEDWNGLKKIEGINQIVGHTPVNKIKIKNMDGTIHVNVDCGHTQVLEVDGKNLRVINTGLKSFYRN